MEGWRRSFAHPAVVAGLLVPMLAGCPPRNPGLSKGMQESADRWRSGTPRMEKAAGRVDAEIGKEIAPPGMAGKQYGGVGTLAPGEAIWLQSGKSRVIQLSHAVTRVSIGNPDLAGVVVLSPRTILVNAKELPQQLGNDNDQGNTMTGQGQRFGVLSPKTLTPPPRMLETSIIVWDSANHADTHTLVVSDFLGQQVLLEVTVAELNRTALEERGIDFRQIGSAFASGYWMGGSGLGPQVPGFATTVPPVPPVGFLPLTFDQGRPQFVFNLPKENITGAINMLQTEGLATILAQPKILALSGQNAVFQVGGEIPIRIVTSFVADVEFKPFGTLVNFLPRITEEGDIVLTVTPEVSQPDFNSEVEGIPTFRTRRASTSARMRSGETLVLGGLVQDERIERVRGIPYLKDVPYLGYFFRNTQYSDEKTELMVIVTPHLVTPIGTNTPVDDFDYDPLTKGDVKTKRDPAEVTRPRFPQPGARH
jgi:pilus assembly protein CpaC